MSERELRPEWFLRPTWAHGLGHTRRVCANVDAIIARLEVPDDVAEAARLAALWHDIGRRDDSCDADHGPRAAERVRELELGADVPADVLWLARVAIHYHSLPDAAARDFTDDEQQLLVLWILKDADALDRTRFGHGALDLAQLRLPASLELLRGDDD